MHPRSFRVGNIYSWKSKWFAKKNYRFMLEQDMRIREFLNDKLKDAGVAEIEIYRSPRLVTVTIHTSRPGIIIGRGGAGVEELRDGVKKIINKGSGKVDVKISIEEIKNPQANAQLVAQSVVDQLEKRIAFKRVLKQGIDKVYEADGVKGVRIGVSGRLNGRDMSRREWLARGNIPLHTLRANVDYASVAAHTIAGLVGVKVWIYKGEVFKKSK